MNESTEKRVPRLPRKKAHPQARELWREVHKAWDLRPDEFVLLLDAVDVITTIEDLRAHVAEDGTMIEGSMGQMRVHPALSEIRHQRALLNTIFKQLGLDEDGAVQRRSEHSKIAAVARWQKTHGA